MMRVMRLRCTPHMHTYTTTSQPLALQLACGNTASWPAQPHTRAARQPAGAEGRSPCSPRSLPTQSLTRSTAGPLCYTHRQPGSHTQPASNLPACCRMSEHTSHIDTVYTIHLAHSASRTVLVIPVHTMSHIFLLQPYVPSAQLVCRSHGTLTPTPMLAFPSPHLAISFS